MPIRKTILDPLRKWVPGLAAVVCGSLFLFGEQSARGAGTVTGGSAAELSAAIQGGGLVTFNFDGTIYLTNTIIVTNDTTLDATDHNVTISGLAGTNSTSTVRIFNLNSGVNLTLLHLTLANGSSTNGGAIFNNGGSLTATNCIFTGNKAIGTNGLLGVDGKDHTGSGGNGTHGGTGGAASGGAIYSSGSVSLSRCLFQNNQVTGGEGGGGGNGGNGNDQGGNGANAGDGGVAYGGAIYSLSTILVTNCVFVGNTATGGNGGEGGLAGSGTYVGFNGSGGAGATGAGGGVYCLGASVVVYSTFSDNRVQGGDSLAGGQANNGNGLNGSRGGDSLGAGICNLGTIALTNCTFFSNQVTGGAGGDGGDSNGGYGGDGGNGGPALGGGIYSSSSTFVNYCTFSSGGAFGGAKGLGGNGVFTGANGSNGAKRGGNVARNSGSFTLKNSVFAYSSSGNNGNGTFIDGGHNISSDGSINLPGTGSLKNTDPKLGSLALVRTNNFTQVAPLLTGSPAINAADPADILAFDERGIPRPIGTNYDIGAYEFEPTFSVQGRITEGTNGVSGVTVTAGSLAAASDTNGYYLISNLIANNYTIAPNPTGVGFDPTNQAVVLGPSVTNLNFVLNRVQITSIVPDTNGVFELAFLGGPNRTYRIEVSTNLTVWQTVATNVAQTNGVFQYTDSVATNFTHRFYRTKTP